MSGGKNGNGSNGKPMYYCYYSTSDGWKLYRPNLDDAGKPTLKDLDMYIVAVKTLFKPEAVLLVSGGKSAPRTLKKLGEKPTEQDLQALALKLHKRLEI